MEGVSFNIEHLQIEEIEGEPRVVDITLGAALGYERPRDIRKLIERFQVQLGELGTSRQRGAQHQIGNGALRETTEYLLNLAQINYLITRCGLPRADEWCIQIARVFTAWQTGKLEASNLEKAVELQDGTEPAARRTGIASLS